jgi:hypothetical protein
MNPMALHWYAGWSMVLAGLLVGSVLGCFFHREGFLGGYASFPRRLVRLGHIALIALGLVNVVLAVALRSDAAGELTTMASWPLLVGSVSMPTMCFLTAFRPRLRFGFAVPILALVLAVVLLLIGGSR